MCLKDEIEKEPNDDVVCGWKVYIKNNDGTYSPCWRRRQDVYALFKRYEAKKDWFSPDPAIIRERAGFYFYHNKKDALRMLKAYRKYWESFFLGSKSHLVLVFG